jgi:hypothetical protein
VSSGMLKTKLFKISTCLSCGRKRAVESESESEGILDVVGVGVGRNF